MGHPWLPSDAGAGFEPLEYFEAEPDSQTPIVVTPRGGTRSVGGSCYQLDTEWGTYLIDCGLNQSGDGQFPDLRGLQSEDIDAVFLTHAHIDHCGGLPVLENRGLLDDDAKIIATEPTIQLAQTLLEDSLKIHLHEVSRGDREQQFTEEDVQALYRRFHPVSYTDEIVSVRDVIPDTPEVEPLAFSVGNAAHLLGSAWFAFESQGQRVVFSGDIGNRAKQLPDIDVPPQADHLFIESTYGATHSHRSMSDASTDLIELVSEAVRNGEPVLIPTFATGRAQTLLLMFNDRQHELPGEIGDEIQLVVDGMAKEVTDHYHTFIRNSDYFDEAMVNRATESGMTTPFLPGDITRPERDADRERIFEQFNPDTGHGVPIILAPSGMLTGGNSPRYLTEMVARYDNAHIVPTGYQASGTLGAALTNAQKAEEETLTTTVDTDPFGNDWPTSNRVSWTQTDSGTATRVTIPLSWLSTLEGLSAHASQAELLSFVRHVEPETVVLIHGPGYAQEAFAEHVVNNSEATDRATRSRLLTPVEIQQESDLATASLTEEAASDAGDLRSQIDDLHSIVTTLSENVTDNQHPPRSEAEIRQIVRDEIETALDEN